MGREIVYCSKCAVRLTGTDFDAKKAFRVGDEIACATCAEALLEGVSPEERDRILNVEADPHLKSSTKMRAARTSSTRMPAISLPVDTGRRKSSLPLVLGGAGGGVVLIIILAATLSEGGKKVEEGAPAPVVEAPPPEPAPSKPPELPPSPRPRPHPKPRELSPEEKRQREIRMARSALESQTRSLLAREEFGAAVKVWEEAMGRFDTPAWKPSVDARVKEIRAEAARLYEGLKRQAAGRKDALVALRRRAVTWGIPEYVAELERLIDPPMSAELKAYREAWREAARLASRRDYDAALAKIKAAADAEDVREEAAKDAEWIGKARAAYRAAVEAAARTEAGTQVELDYVHRPGDVREINGFVVRADAERAEVLTADEKTVFLDWEDLTADSLVAFLEEGRGDPLLVLEGAPDVTPPSRKYAEHARAVRGKVPARDPKEYEARDLFHAAELQWRDVERRGEAIGTYARLRSGYADTAVVRGSSEFVAKRSEAGKEYVIFPPELKAGGEFRRSKHKGLEFAWTNARDLGENDEDSFVETEFYALPGAAYQAWAYVGACCRETFTFYCQTTDATMRDPKNRSKRVSLDPGSPYSEQVEHRVRFLRRTHVAHGGPKTPSRWAWIRIPLPEKYEAPGRKAIRLLSDQKGFSVGYVVVSSVRTKAPTKDETDKLADELGKMDLLPELAITGLRATSGKAYKLIRLVKGARSYIDRDFVYVSYPAALEGKFAIQTANDDKNSTGDRFITFSVNRDVTVYVFHDPRVTSKPTWLSSFTATGETMEITRQVMTVFRKTLAAGPVVLGGNQKSNAGHNMYLVVVVPDMIK